MCGITGFIDFNRQTSPTTLTSMTASMTHRGPDGSDTYFHQNDAFQLGFGHRRLAILELSELGKQPMHWEHYSIVFNGEIYNFEEIKTELSALGHQFKAHSDTEMILHAFAEWGIECIQKFIGMFAFVLWDKKEHRAFVVRDRAGVKPLFIYFKQQILLFASELKAFHAHPKFEKSINIGAVQAYLHYGNVPTPHCIFNDAFKVKPGHYLSIDLTKQQPDLTQHCYWNVYDAYNAPKNTISYNDALAETEQLIRSASNYRMVADVPVGVFLSGGYDSTAVTALLQSERTERLKTYTIAVPDMGLNEAPYAKDIATRLGTDHTEITCSVQDALDFIPELSHYYDEPFADSSAIPTHLVSKIARQSVTVALSADAGDELFAGYNRYDMILRYGAKLNKVPQFAKSLTAGIMDIVPAHRIPVLKNKYNFAQRYEKTKSILRNSSSHSILMSLSQLFTKEQVSALVKQSYISLETYYDSKELLHPTPLSFAQAMDYQTYLLDDILQKVDRASMAVSLESREPFLDHRLIEWAAQLPDEYKYLNGTKKRILKDIVHKHIDPSLMDRPKMGFAIPIESWLQNELKDLVELYLSKHRIDAEGIFHWSEIEQLKNRFYAGRKEFGVKIWYLLCFQMWLEKWK